MSRLLRSRAWSVLALIAGVTSLWAGDNLWLRLVCAVGLAVGIAQQLALLALSVRRRMLGTFWIRLSVSTMLCVGVAGWYLANSQGMPGLVIAGLAMALTGLWWFRNRPDFVQLQARNLPGAPEPPRPWRRGGGRPARR